MDKNISLNYEFAKNEKEILKLWEDKDYFSKLKEKNKNGKKYRFIDGPITANNPMGIHHAWGRSLKDTYLKYKAMNGYESHYRNGFDGQGLWVEVEVEKELGFKTKSDIENYGMDKFTEKCIERVRKYSKVITEQSKRLGQWMDWDNSYYTYTDENITSIWKVLKKCHEQGWIKQIYRPMPWCTRCGTSLSEHEMSGSYKEIEHEAVFVKLPVKSLESNILVWTTTPWTLSSNVALAVNAELDYYKVELPQEEKPLIMAKNYFESKFLNKDDVRILEVIKGECLKGIKYETCFPDFEAQKHIIHKIVLWEEVADNEGSGVVHIAPGCGSEDFELGKKENLDIINPIDEYGIFINGFGFLVNKSASEAKQEIFNNLKEQNKLFYTHKIKHSYPVCWRCKHEILFRLVKEWAIDVDEIRPKLIENAKKVKWIPAYEEKRMLDWLNNMAEWNISRKRFYGLPLPFYKCEECGELTVVSSIEELRNLAVDKSLVDKLPHIHRPWIDDIEIGCPKCKVNVKRVSQVGDVWLDAGIVPFSTLKYFENKEYWKDYFPAELVIEMKEQIRLWFYSMLFMSTVLTGKPPYEKVATHGMVTAEDGSRFSKTGFMIRFDEAADTIGADASRYLFASNSMSSDVRFGYTLGDEAKRKILSFWSLSVFFATYMEIDNIDIDLNKLDINKIDITDKWLILRINKFINDATKDMEEYLTRDVVQKFEAVVDDISNFYIRVNRRRFWREDSIKDKMNAYMVLFYGIKTITQIMAPIIPFVTEHVWQEIIRRYSKGNFESVHLSNWPKVEFQFNEDDYSIVDDVKCIRNIISLALKCRNEKQIKIRQPLAKITVNKTNEICSAVSKMKHILLNEINIYEVDVNNDMSTIENYVVAIDFKIAGGILKGDVNKVNALLRAFTAEEHNRVAKDILNEINVRILGYDAELPYNIFTLNTKPKDNIVMAKEGEVVVALDIVITEEMYKEGFVRDILRQCQVMRKDANFNIDDRIELEMITGSEYLEEVITQNKNYIEEELLAKVSKIDKPNFEQTLKFDNKEILVKMKKK